MREMIESKFAIGLVCFLLGALSMFAFDHRGRVSGERSLVRAEAGCSASSPVDCRAPSQSTPAGGYGDPLDVMHSSSEFKFGEFSKGFISDDQTRKKDSQAGTSKREKQPLNLPN